MKNFTSSALAPLRKRFTLLMISLLVLGTILASSSPGLSYIPRASTNEFAHGSTAQQLLEPPSPPDQLHAMSVLPSTNSLLETGPVSIVSAKGLIQKPAHLFDLEGKTLQFTPTQSGYKLQVQPLKMASDWGRKLDYSSAIQPTAYHVPYSWSVPLPFAFPFAEHSWQEVFVSLYGNISFGKSETALWLQRNPASDGGMRTVAAALDTHSMVGLEQLIAVFWADYQPRTAFAPVQESAVYAKATNQSLVVTWQVVRQGYYTAPPAGVNIFQARLFPSGRIELAYQQVPERDGIVGLFPGTSSPPLKLDYVKAKNVSIRDAAHLESVTVNEVGSLLEFKLLMRDRIPLQSSPRLWYRVFFNYPGRSQGCEYAVIVTDKVEVQNSCEVDPPLSTLVYINDKTLTFHISKVDLRGAKQFSWAVGVYQGEQPTDGIAAWNNQRLVNLRLPSQPLSSSTRDVRGNIFEVFHYAAFPKWPQYSLEEVYKQFPPDDDIALVFTDFPIDVLRGAFNSSQFNTPIQGLGGGLDKPGSGATFGSKRLQVSTTTTYIGMGYFAKALQYLNWKYDNYAFAAGIIVHEVGHRWLAHLSFRNPHTNQIQSLGNAANGGCECHWNQYLHAPSIFAISHAYTDKPYPLQEHSPMEGNVWQENTDGTFTKKPIPLNAPITGGFSALDLYAIGILPPRDVPDTFLLENVKPIDKDGNHVHATKTPVRMQDIISVMGSRIPSSAASQKQFTFSVYLLHEDGRKPYSDMLTRAQGISGAGAKVLTLATGGQLKILFNKGNRE